MLRIKRVLLAALFLGMVCALPATAAAAADTPQAIVQGMVDRLSKAIDGHQTELREHPDQMTKIIDTDVLPNFDLGLASLLVLGTHAAAATPAQRVAFSNAFYGALTRSYAEAMINFATVKVNVLPSPVEPDATRALVRIQVLQNGGGTLSVGCVFRKNAQGEWKAYDVIVEGVSYITLYRSQVNSQIQREGIDSVIKRLKTEGIAVLGQ
ncbi:MAG: MlaC/ttg2D family ABC transporter substrate-binding protein [Rhodanobacteraceae bacterium]